MSSNEQDKGKLDVEALLDTAYGEDEVLDPDAHHRDMSDGVEDGLVPLDTLDVGQIGDFDQMLAAMARTSFGGRNLGEAAEVLETMVSDPKCTVVLTLSGAMTVAKMNLVITEMVERGWVQAIVSTGALMTHGLVELAGMSHFKATKEMNDTELFHKGYNRVYDTYEPEKNLNDLSKVMKHVFDAMPTDRRWSSRMLLAETGKLLAQTGKRGIMSACWKKGVPVYIPAFTDSELGLDFGVWLLERRLSEGVKVQEALTNLTSPYDPYLDLGHYARMVEKSPRLGIFTIGGGVPRNWAQQAPPFLDIINTALGKQVELNRFRYGVRICPEPVHWGGLSGCTYSEGVSWGKFLPPSRGGRTAEVYADATIAWPILVKGVAERMDKAGKRAASPALGIAGYGPPAQ